MLQLIIICIVLIIMLVILYKLYKPTIDFVTTDNKIIILLWYNKYYNDIDYTRTYKQIAKFKTF